MTLTIWQPGVGFVGVDEPCDITSDKWCATHSTADGPVYCEPAADHEWPKPT